MSLPAHNPAEKHPFRWTAVGVALALHFTLLASLKVARGVEGELLWYCHTGLALAATGILIRSSALVGTAFITVACMHAVWIVDASTGCLTGAFPFGFTSYLAQGDLLTNLATSHHLYLCPLLLLWLRSRGGAPRESLPIALVLVITLTFVSRFVLPPALNVNFAHAVLPESTLRAFVWYNAQPAPVFLGIHTVFVLLTFLIPAAWVAVLLSPRRCQLTQPRIRKDTAAFHHHRPRARTAFSLIELIAVLVLVSILGGIAIPRYIDYTASAKQSADEGALGAIKSSLHAAFLHHRANSSPSNEWVTSVSHIAATLENNTLPNGITINGARLQDSRGNLYNLSAETSTTPALLTLHVSSGGNGCS